MKTNPLKIHLVVFFVLTFIGITLTLNDSFAHEDPGLKKCQDQSMKDLELMGRQTSMIRRQTKTIKDMGSTMDRQTKLIKDQQALIDRQNKTIEKMSGR